MTRAVIPPSTEQAVLTRIAAGEFRADIARSTGVSEYGVTMIAKRHGVEVAKCPIGSRWGKLDKLQADAKKTLNDPAAEWRAKAWASRRFGGNGYVS